MMQLAPHIGIHLPRVRSEAGQDAGEKKARPRALPPFFGQFEAQRLFKTRPGQFGIKAALLRRIGQESGIGKINADQISSPG